MEKKYTKMELYNLLASAGHPNVRVGTEESIPTSDELAASIEALTPYLKIRFCQIGYFSDHNGAPLPATEGERWGCTIAVDGSDYCWCASLWEALAIAYLRLTKNI